MTTIHVGDCSTGCLECAYQCATGGHDGCTGGDLREWATERADANRPARVQGSHGRGLAIIVADARGDLVDIEYLCAWCARESNLWGDALDWPAFDFGESGAWCRECGEQID